MASCIRRERNIRTKRPVVTLFPRIDAPFKFHPVPDPPPPLIIKIGIRVFPQGRDKTRTLSFTGNSFSLLFRLVAFGVGRTTKRRFFVGQGDNISFPLRQHPNFSLFKSSPRNATKTRFEISQISQREPARELHSQSDELETVKREVGAP